MTQANDSPGAEPRKAAQDQTRPPNWKPRDRGSREGDPRADSSLPGRQYGAGGHLDDGPDVTAGAGSPPEAPGGRGSSRP